jgi:hypothetical protein
MTRSHRLLAAALALGLATAASAAPTAAPAPSTAIFAALDANHDGAVSAQEFAAGYPGLQRAVALGIRLREQFGTVDTNHSGAIEDGEYAGLVLVRQAGASAPLLATFDANADHRLDFAEYVALVRKLAAAPPATGGR